MTNIQSYDLFVSTVSQFRTGFYPVSSNLLFLLSALNKGISLKRSKTNRPLLQAKMLPTSCNSSYKEVKNKPICFRKVCKNQQNIVFFEKKYPRVKFHPGLISVHITSANVLICKRLINESRNLATL